jgi:hypothetical protein
MEEGNGKSGESERTENEEIYSRVIKTGKRTYFIDVKATRRNDLYLTVTESRKRFYRDGRFFFEKHKIFLYREEFARFLDVLTDVMEFIRDNQEEQILDESYEDEINYNVDGLHENVNIQLQDAEISSYSNLNFDDLDNNR